MTILSLKKKYQEFKTELEICEIGGLFLALYDNKKVPKLIIEKLNNDHDLIDFFQFPLYMDETKVPFPILFEQTFEQIGSKSNIFHILGIEENLSSEAAQDFLGYLQYARERLKAKPYSLVFWITSEFEKKLFFQAPDFHHWVFGTYDFRDIDDEELKSLTRSENTELFDVQKIYRYLEKVIWQYQNWEKVKNNKESFLLEPMEKADLYNYYLQSYCIYLEEKENEITKKTYKEEKEILLDDLLKKFIRNEKQNFLTLLGDFGSGKSSFSIHYFIELAKKYITDRTKRIPIFISLKDYKGKLNLEKFMIKEFYDKFNIKINFSIFQELALEGRFVFFVDGFDEMASLADREITNDNFRELTKLSFENILFLTKTQNKNYQANKVLLTSRTHYFLTESQEKDILKADYTVLYRNYATKSNYEITRIKLKEFNVDQIREYIKKYTKNEEITSQYLKIIENTYNLKDLSVRPLLLEMIINTLPILKNKKNINPANLYQAYTSIWIERDDWRSQMTPQGKRNFMWEMAVKMFELGGDFSLHYSNLDKPKDEYLKDTKDEDRDYYSYESTTCSFLNRDTAGNYKFIHKSFMEYFVAESFYWHLRQDKTQILQYSSFNTEIKFFLKNIIARHKPKLDSMDLRGADLRDADLRSANLCGTDLNSADLSNADLRDADLRAANLSCANLSCADIRGVKLCGAYLSNADLSNADLSNADLSNVDLKDAKLCDADLWGANLNNADLSRANLWGANLNNADLSRANLNNADLSNADLWGANLNNADLSNANLSRANLWGVNLSNVNLRDAKLCGADLSSANLSNANLNCAILIKVKNTIPSQIKFTFYWDKAFYKGYWNDSKSKWVIDKQANQKYIDQLKQSIE